MLTLTENAQHAVKELVERSNGAEGAGLRIDAEAPGSDRLGVAVVPAPELRDATISEGGANVYLGMTAATFLDDKVLDAHEQDGRVEFEVLPQV
ncbi:hypothetical protein [Agromyces seonyuensis]|uniref:hypothetical protein n=1 Tax=Agromyces seonyuensis TaxID=2662446 RepID=UPI00136677A4|nr:hypothetical protein [Agromyces seonyuensis]